MRNIRFFTQADNQSVSTIAKTKKVKKLVPLVGYVSNMGKLVLPTKTVQATSDLGSVRAMKVGSPVGKRKLTTLYLIPTDEQNAEGFPVMDTPRGIAIELAQILTGGRINYKAEKYNFTLLAFIHQAGTTGYELRLTTPRVEEKRLTPASPEDVSLRQNNLLLPTVFQFASHGARHMAFFRRSLEQCPV